MKHITLSRTNLSVAVDDDVFEWLSKLKVYRAGGDGKYAGFFRKEKGRRVTILVHREIMQPKKRQVVDHINRDTLDCRRANLRITNQHVNTLNSKKGEMSGATFDPRRNKWFSRIRTSSGKRNWLGYFPTKELAERAYREARALNL